MKLFNEKRVKVDPAAGNVFYLTLRTDNGGVWGVV